MSEYPGVARSPIAPAPPVRVEAGWEVSGARSDAALTQQLAGLNRDGHFGAGREQRHIGLLLRSDDLVGAGGATVRLLKRKTQLRQILAR